MRTSLLYILIVILLSSCGIRTIQYNKARSLNATKAYTCMLNNDTQIELEKYYLDTDNIVEIKANKKTQTITIIQFDKQPTSFTLSDIELTDFKTENHIKNQDRMGLIVLNGILISKNEWNDYRIEHNAVKSISILKDTNINPLHCRPNKRQVLLLIQTK